MAQCAVRFCEICEQSPGNQYCVNCEQYFCNNCKIPHLKAKVSKQHKFEEADKVNPEVKIPKCEQHNEHYSFYCNTCTCLLCQLCLTQNHKKHDFLLITEAVSRKKEDLKSLMQSAENNTKQLLTKVAKLESDLGESKDCGKKIVGEIESKRKEMIKMVNSVADDYIARVQQNETKESRRMEEEIDKRRKAVQNDKVIIEATRKATENGDDVKFLATVVDIQNKLMSLQLSESNVNKFQTLKFTRSSATQIKEIQTLFGSFSIEQIRPMKEVKIGDRVKVKASVTQPMYNWGGVNHNSIGTVVMIMRTKIIVNFPECHGWNADLNDLEYA